MAPSRSKINTGLTAIWSTAAKIPKWKIPPRRWVLPPCEHGGVRAAGQASRPAQQPLIQTGEIRSNRPSECRRLSLNTEVTGSLLFISGCFGSVREDFVKAKRLSL